MKLALAGASHELTALVRDPQRLPMGSPRLRVVTGSVLDPATVELVKGKFVRAAATVCV